MWHVAVATKPACRVFISSRWGSFNFYFHKSVPVLLRNCKKLINMDYSKIEEISRKQYPNTYDGIIEYGTAGFRTRSEILEHVLYRMGILAVLRSKETNSAIGLMITASHNLEPDNGVKLVDPTGEMLEASWEAIATRVANAADADLVDMIRRIVKERNIDEARNASVIIGRDTRKSSPRLAAAAIAAVTAANATHNDYGVVTTPQLHYLVERTNANNGKHVHIDEYYDKLVAAFQRLHPSHKGRDNQTYEARAKVDAANGVGAIATIEFKKRLNDTLTIEVANVGDGALNDKCGADYVKIQQAPPLDLSIKPNERWLSIDGDADRIVYYYVDEAKKFHLLDGDRIATLVASYLKELIEASGLPSSTVQLGLVQTAYANGASTDYISQVLKIPVACAPTGVKHLHKRAHDFGIGVYFEANGHGTAVFKDSVMRKIREVSQSTDDEEKKSAATILVNLADVINQQVGDALSIMLLVESILYAKGWNLATWEQSYTDFPNKQLKIRVKDRKLITTADAERKCLTPEGLQDKIDELVALYPKGRAFVRPSGTEDIVRVYAECEKPEDVEKLAAQVSLAVYQLAGGVPPQPLIPS